MHEAKPTNPCILVVEEDTGVRRFLEVALASHGFATISAASGVDGLHLFRACSHEIDLVLMDVQMAEMDGAATLLRMRDLDPQVRCCFMTGDTSLSRSKELLQLGARHVFPKPFLSIQDLTSKLHDVLQQDSPAAPLAPPPPQP